MPSPMTKLVLELKNEKQVALLKAILKFLNIPIQKEERVEEEKPVDMKSFYQQFQVDLSTFHFDREAANER